MVLDPTSTDLTITDYTSSFLISMFLYRQQSNISICNTIENAVCGVL